jgi:hypothetical protein
MIYLKNRPVFSLYSHPYPLLLSSIAQGSTQQLRENMCHFSIICGRHRDQDQLMHYCRGIFQNSRCTVRTANHVLPNPYIVCPRCARNRTVVPRRNPYNSNYGSLDEPHWTNDGPGNPLQASGEPRDPFPWVQQSSLRNMLPLMRGSPTEFSFDLSNNSPISLNTSRSLPSADNEPPVPSYLQVGNSQEVAMDRIIFDPSTNAVARENPEAQIDSPTPLETQPPQIREACSPSSAMSPIDQPESSASNIPRDENVDDLEEIMRGLGFEEGMRIIDDFFCEDREAE